MGSKDGFGQLTRDGVDTIARHLSVLDAAKRASGSTSDAAKRVCAGGKDKRHIFILRYFLGWDPSKKSTKIASSEGNTLSGMHAARATKMARTPRNVKHGIHL